MLTFVLSQKGSKRSADGVTKSTALKSAVPAVKQQKGEKKPQKGEGKLSKGSEGKPATPVLSKAPTVEAKKVMQSQMYCLDCGSSYAVCMYLCVNSLS